MLNTLLDSHMPAVIDDLPVSREVVMLGAIVSVAVIFFGISLSTATTNGEKSTAAKTFPPLAIFEHIVQHLKRRAKAWSYLLNGPVLIREGYKNSNGKSYELLAPDARMVFISSPEEIKYVDKAPDNLLSLNGAAKHMLQPLYTMNGFNWFDKRGVEGVGFVRTLRTLLTNNLPSLVPDLTILSRNRFDELRASKSKTVNGQIHSPIYPMMMDIVVLLNAYSLFGKELASDEQWKKDALAYVEETLINAEVVKLMPKALAPVVGGLLSRRLDAHKNFFQSLVPVAEERCRERDLANLGHEVPKHADCISWIIETAPKNNPWSAERVIYELMAIWFGSVHILSTTMVYVIHDLCLHPEYVEPLRKELEQGYADFEKTGQGLPLLDSFIKESARLSPVESMAVRRCALQPFTLADGSHLNPGDWTCAPSGAINREEKHYPSADTFNGFRFVEQSQVPNELTNEPAQQPKPSKITDVDHTWLMWGTGRMACPGRYYASAFMKVVVAQILMKYDMELVEPNAARWMYWRAALLPKQSTMVNFTPRASS